MYTGDLWYNTRGESGVQSFYCVVGDTIEICHPLFYKGATVENVSSTIALKGFRVLYPNLGELSDVESGEYNCVRYTHKKSGKQVIEFTEDLALSKSYLVLEAVSPHSHDSIAMGGPAYATYFTEIPTEES